MAKETKGTENQHEQQNQQKSESIAVTEYGVGQSTLTELPGGFLDSADATPIQAQVARLSDPHLLTLQRQAVAAQLGRVQGNQYLQRVVAARKNEETLQRQTHAEHSSIGRQQSVHYEPGEREESLTSPGNIGGQTTSRRSITILFNFGENQATLKLEHQSLLVTQISEFNLNGTIPRAQIRAIIGYTDQVDSERVNAPLRRLRAEAVVQFLLQHGVRSGHIDVVRGAPEGQMRTNNDSRIGRTQNRAVVLEIELTQPVPPPPPNRNPIQPTVPRSRRWSLMTMGTFIVAEVGAGGSGLFTLTNLETGEHRLITFIGVGLGGGYRGRLPWIPPRASMSLPSPTEFETTAPVTFDDFTGYGLLEIASLEAMVMGLSAGYVQFNGNPVRTTLRRGVWIGGFGTGGLGATIASLGGRWIVPSR